MSGVTREVVDIIKTLGICDATGHVASCGYDEHGACSCSTLPQRLADALAAAGLVAGEAAVGGVTVTEDEREQIALAIEDLNSQVTGDIHHRGIWAMAVSEAARIARTTTAAPHMGNPAADECASCGENMPPGECPESQRPCGHHCNHSWTHDGCDWCGTHFGENVAETKPSLTEAEEEIQALNGDKEFMAVVLAKRKTAIVKARAERDAARAALDAQTAAVLAVIERSSVNGNLAPSITILDDIRATVTDPSALDRVKAEVWDQGVSAAYNGMVTRQAALDVMRANPYRATAAGEGDGA